ncbi:hypothetical protein Tco_0892927 [Tanacetum coccineum]|uniref:Uncharacterized protein n=1 Tax=Tanacetum coccineum TaxID=301880 RepID=A0ABQ5C7B6_9ASTR
MIDELSIVETDKVNHIVEMDMLRLVVEFECFGKCIDEFDKVIVLFGEMQLKQEDQSYVHASNGSSLHVVHVVPIYLLPKILRLRCRLTRAEIFCKEGLGNDIKCFDVQSA